MIKTEEIIDGCKRHNAQSQRLLYERYSSLLLGVCMRYARDRAEAEDILQEAFVKIFFHIHEYQAIGSFEGWMRAVVVNTAVTYYHKNAKHHNLKDIEMISEAHLAENADWDLQYSAEDLLMIIGRLPEGYRIIFNLYAIEGYKHKDIAQMLKIDVNTSKSQYSRARKLIQTKLLEIKQRARL